MVLKIKTLLLLLLILLIPLSGLVEGFKVRMNPASYSLYKDGNIRPLKLMIRKLPELDSLLDYDDPGPNPKHDYPSSPPKKKPGNGRNP